MKLLSLLTFKALKKLKLLNGKLLIVEHSIKFYNIYHSLQIVKDVTYVNLQ